jgi:hypothetical protein
MELSTTTRRSKGWYVLPILLGIIGGIIGYYSVRNDDAKMAKQLLIVGITVSGVAFGATVVSHLI